MGSKREVSENLYTRACRVTELWSAGEDVGDAIAALGTAVEAERDREPGGTGDETPDPADARAYVATSARGLIGDLRSLQSLISGEEVDAPEGGWESLGVSVDDDGLVDVDEAVEALYAMALAVEATTTFEVVLGVGGPDRRLCFECNRERNGQPEHEWREPYEIRRVFYRYSWGTSVGIKTLEGEGREVAEAFGRRVVPELGE